ncbi:unnamed protein product [Peniophora sp. CBMAI 1063]|nr:unnamed protein product [Peniophora sp. CBMAI 1063]
MNTNELEAMSKAHSELSPASQSLDYEAVIFKLPDELLLEVFLLLRDAMYPSLHPYPALHQLPSWVAVSCVCARFRRVALGSPGLHTCIPMRALPRKLTKQELTLSRPLDLDIETLAASALYGFKK